MFYFFNRHIKFFCSIIAFQLFFILSVEGGVFRIYNLTEAPVYLSVCSVDGNKAVTFDQPAIGFYEIPPAGGDFLQGTQYNMLASMNIRWPSAQCAETNLFGSCLRHYPRTVFFSLSSKDIAAGEFDVNNPGGAEVTYLDKKIPGSVYQGWQIGDGASFFLFYNPFAFDPEYAAYGRLRSDKYAVIRGEKINSAQVNASIASVLRRYLEFAKYQYFNK